MILVVENQYVSNGNSSLGESEKHRNGMEVGLIDIFRNIIDIRKTIYKVVGIGMLVGIIVALSIPKQYTVKVTLFPEMGSSKGGNGLAGLAASFLGSGASLGENLDALNASLSSNRIAFVPFSPVASGLLSGKITPNTEFGRVDDVRVWVPQLKRENIAGNMPIVEMLRSFAAEKQATPAQVSLAWMLRKYTNVVPIPGSKNKERIMENLRACEVQLTDEEFDRLESELDRLPIYGIRGHAETEQTSFGNNWLKQK